MKNIYLKLALSALLIPSLGYTDGLVVWNKDPTEAHVVLKTTPLYEYNNRIVVFLPWHQAYERIKPNALYWGLEAWMCALTNRDRNTLLDAEFRMGYNYLYNGVDHLTPFAGVGYIQNYSYKHHHHHKPGITYGTIGFLYDHEFGNIFNIGVNLKGLIGGPVNKRHFNWGSPVIGGDLSVPITFRFGHNRHWDLRIEPYNTYLYGKYADAYYVGFRNTIGYRF